MALGKAATVANTLCASMTSATTTNALQRLAGLRASQSRLLQTKLVPGGTESTPDFASVMGDAMA